MDPDSNLNNSCLVLEECLKRNSEAAKKIDDATRVIQERLSIIRSHIDEINTHVREAMCIPINEHAQQKSREDSKILFQSEWNDTIGCPPNADTIAKHQETGVTYPLELKSNKTAIWTGVQSRSLCSIIHKLEVDERVKEYSEKRFKLAHLADSLQIAALKKELAEFDFSAVKNKPLEELVITGKDTYDWEKVSNLLHRAHSPIECKARWYHYLHPRVNRSNWTQEEDLRLLAITEKNKEQDWETIAASLGTGRSAYSCFTAYQSRLRGMAVSDARPKAGMATHLTRELGCEEGGWTRNDDCALASAVTKSQGVNGIAWDQVMQSFPNKSRKQLFARWSQVLDPALRRGNLTYVEQKAIVIGTRRFGLEFSRIRNKLIPHRTISQLRHYTLYRINNCTGRGKWTLFAEHVFRALVEFLGPGNWREVGSFFPYMSVKQIKRRYERQLCDPERHATIYIVSMKIRESITEFDLETCKLIDHWEKIKPLNFHPALEPGVSQQVLSEVLSSEIETEYGGAPERYEQFELPPSTTQASPREPLREDSGLGSSKENEDQMETDDSDDNSMASVDRPRRGRPPSKKKKKERTKPKRTYVRSGRYVITTNENSEIKLNLRPKT